MTSDRASIERIQFPRGSGLRKPSRESGLTVVEIAVALLVLSFLSLFALNVLNYTRMVQLETSQRDFAVQTAREVLNQIKAEPDWREVEKHLSGLRRFNADFTIQLLPSEAMEKGVVNLELTISWIGPRRLEQLVFSTSVLDPGGAG
jgi:Tfp pilus assembly protein PilV